MTGVYTMRASELTEHFISSVKELFRDREIEIKIRDLDDSTAYLLSSNENRSHLLRSLAQASDKSSLISVSEVAL